MPAQVRYYTDPACSWSWAAEPKLRRLMWEFGESLSFTWVMGGLARDYTSKKGVYSWLLEHWLEVAAESRMPFDPLLWKEGPIGSTYPSCMAVKAAQEQADDGGYRYLRELREGLMCFRRKLDTTEALVEAARGVGLGVERFRIDLGSNAIVEAFGADLEDTRREGERLPLPSVEFRSGDDGVHGVYGTASYDELRAAAIAAGAEPVTDERPDVKQALTRFGRMATLEVEEVCGLPEPRAQAELWRLASDWEVKPVRVLTGWLWELA